MPSREPLSLWSERPDCAISSHRSGDLIFRPPRPSYGSGILDPVLLDFARNNR